MTDIQIKGNFCNRNIFEEYQDIFSTYIFLDNYFNLL